MRELVQELTDRLEHHLNQLCDAKACETPEHAVTRRLITTGRQSAWRDDALADRVLRRAGISDQSQDVAAFQSGP